MTYRSLAEMFLSQAKRCGNRTLYRFAVEGRWKELSWQESLARVREIALGLLALGVRRGDRVAIAAANRVEWSLIDWANICAGALTVPLYPSSTASQVAYILAHSGARILFVDSPERLKKLDWSQPSLDKLRTIVLIDSAAPLVDIPAGISVISLNELQRQGRDYGHEHGEAFEQTALSLRPEDDLTIIYTSGTTGESKGVLTTHSHYLFMLQSVVAAIPCGEGDVVLQFLPLAHSFGRLEHFLAVAEGFTCCFARSLETVAGDLLAVRPTLLFSVPRVYENAYRRILLRAEAAAAPLRALFHWAQLVAARRLGYLDRKAPVPLPLRVAYRVAERLVFARIRRAFGGRLRLAISGGAALSPEIAGFFHGLGILVLEGYGLTECSTVSHVNRVERHKRGTVGLALPGVECRIAPDGQVLLRGPNVLKEYYRDPAATREILNADGWLHTGDIGEIDGDGFLRITDRKKDIIVTSGGKNVAPLAIESALKADPLILQAMVIGDGQRHLMALVTLNQERVAEWAAREGIELGAATDALSHPRINALIQESIRRANRELAAFEAVRSFRILPREFTVEGGELTPTLKLRRHVIRERYKDIIAEMSRKP
jgi:long-chain acyl-CoA synthetase